MRIKFEKGFSPDAVAEIFRQYVYENDVVIGSVNIYVQTYDKDMKANKFNDDNHIVIRPTDKTKKEYSDYVANVYRGNFKEVSNGS